MDASIQNLSSLFCTPVSFRIPLFQRPYAWGKERQWDPLWLDVQRIAERLLAKKDASTKFLPHFMGAIVLQLQSHPTGEVAKRIVVDGQQRLTTLQVLIRAAQESFRSVGEAEQASSLSPLLLNSKDQQAGDLENETKVRQSNTNDLRDFRDVIINSDGYSTLGSIGQCYDHFRVQILNWLEKDVQGRTARCKALKEVLTCHLQLATVDLDEKEKPHYIFSVLNARSEALRESDHIKNTVMYETNVVDEAVKAAELWGIFDSDLWWRQDTKEGRLNRIHLDRFLNYWVMMKSGSEVTANRVSVEFTDYFEKSVLPNYQSSRLAMEDLAKNLGNSGRIYKDLETEKQPGIEISLQRIKTMELGVVMPILLWFYSTGRPGEECVRAVQVLESYLVRRMLYGIPAQGLNRLFIELIGKLENHDAESADQVVVEFLRNQTVDNRIWPNDRMLRQALMTGQMPGGSGRKIMILKAIEVYLRGNLSESFDGKSLTLEHIMPDSWERNWPLPGVKNEDEEREIRNLAVKQIGNLTLVTGKLNSALSNSAWNHKKNELRKHTTLRLNLELLQDDPDIWDEDSITARSTKLIDAIIEIWKYADRI